jgi:flagellar biosynthetic protein FliP
VILVPAVAAGADQQASAPAAPADVTQWLPELESPGAISTALKWLAIVTVLSLVPAILVMVTSFTRIVVVLGLLRQALATQQLPPNQILFGLAMLMTLVVMGPVFKDVHRDAIAPYFDGKLDRSSAMAAGEARIRTFLIHQIEGAGNTDDVYLFLPDEIAKRGELTWRDVPTLSLIPGFVISELKVAFTMGFRIFLPFVIIDMLVASVLVSMGMLMLPPVLISLPFKLLLFVLANGWHLVVGTLMSSFT